MTDDAWLVAYRSRAAVFKQSQDDATAHLVNAGRQSERQYRQDGDLAAYRLRQADLIDDYDQRVAAAWRTFDLGVYAEGSGS